MLSQLAHRAATRPSPLKRLLQAAAQPDASAGVHASDAAPPVTPGELDARHGFAEGESVAFWRSWKPGDALGGLSLAGALSAAASEAPDAASVRYWAYHLLRLGFFSAQGVAGLAASGQLAAGQHPLTGERGSEAVTRSAKLVLEALATFRQDCSFIRRGAYREPWDMSELRHRQFNPLFVLDRGARFLAEARATLSRRAQGRPDDVWLRSPLYPADYLKTWHYQSDGWLSPASAAVYESSTETLFVGRQDAMQRAGLALLLEHARSQPDAGFGRMSVLDVAAGTGRFLTFVRDNLPAADVTALDLSPFYLAEAREAHAHWESLRGGPGRAVFVQAAAEAMPFADGSFDAVTCVYLLHELPPDSRRAVAREAARVLRPGGVLVLVDSVQLGDRGAAVDAGLPRFGDFNEPHYNSYIATDLGALFKEAGLTPWRKEVCSATKALAFTKPEQRGGDDA